MTYADAIQFLYGLQLFGSQFGLERPLRLSELAGHPQNHLRFIHVAGTNGKGSTCAMLDSIYRAAGLRVGLYTSPHLVSFRERMQVDRHWIAEDDVARLVAEAQGWLNHLPAENHPTFFEVVTVIALKYFQEQKCELVIWETGLGGRLDATNIVTPLASVITNVQFDHEIWLGNSLEEIAREKAGIIKPRVPVISAAREDAALRVMQETAAVKLAPLHLVRQPERSFAIGLAGEHQRLNAALAIKTVEVLNGVIPAPGTAVRAGLETVHWPGRFQVLRRGAQTIILDGAHNPAGAAALVETLDVEFRTAALTFIVGVLADKNWESVLSLFARRARQIICVPVASSRTALPVTLAQAARNANPAITTYSAASVVEALSLGSGAPYLVFTGSLYLVGEALELLGEVPGSGERALNEWSARPR